LTDKVGKKNQATFYFAMATWLSNLCYVFSTSLDTFSQKMESLCMT